MSTNINWKVISSYIDQVVNLFTGQYNSTSVLQNKILYLYIRKYVNDNNAKPYIDLFKTMNDYLYDDADIRQELRAAVLELKEKYKPRKVGRSRKVKYKNKTISLNGYCFAILPYIAKNWMDKNIKYLGSPICDNVISSDTFMLRDMLDMPSYKNATVWLFMKHFMEYNSIEIGEMYNLNPASVRRKIMKMKKSIK